MKISDENKAELDRIRKMPWSAHFHKTMENQTVPGGKIDMYLLVDDDSGEEIVALSVPHGRGWIAEYVAGCCADPYFVRENIAVAGKISVAWARALKPFIDKDGCLDARDVHAAAMAMIEGYVGNMPRHSRQPLIDRTIAMLGRIRERP